MIARRAMKEVGPEWTAHLNYISRHSSVMGDILAGAHYRSARPAAVSSIPYGYKRRAIIAPNVYPTGDRVVFHVARSDVAASIADKLNHAVKRTRDRWGRRKLDLVGGRIAYSSRPAPHIVFPCRQRRAFGVKAF